LRSFFAAVALLLIPLWWMHTRLQDLEARLAAPPTTAPAPAVAAAPPPAPLIGLERRLAALERRGDTSPHEDPDTNTSADGTAADAPPIAAPLASTLELLEPDTIADLASNFGAYDEDGDGLLDAEELLVSADALQPADLNADRRLGRDEVERLQELGANARAAAARLDGADAQFPIEEADFKDGPRRFAYLDRDGDGLVSEAEYLSTQTAAVKQLRRFDLDHNGALTESELWDAPTRFAAADLDGDNLLYAWEVSRLMARAKW